METFKNRIALLILSVFFIGILMTSCTKDDETPKETEGSIIGRWALDKRHYKVNGVITPTLDYENNNPGCALNDYFEFKENGVAATGYYSANCAITPSVGGKWTKNGEMITLSDPFGSFSEDFILKLLSLSATEMKVSSDLTGTSYADPGVDLVIYYTMVKVN